MLQSFLVIGHPDQRRKKTLEIFERFSSNLSKNSPDITIISPIKKTTTIDQVREMKLAVYQKPLKLPYKFVIFEDAQTLNKEAQNALLKILEEPPVHAIMILESHNKSGLLPTILSRVAVLWAKNPKQESASESLLDLDETAMLEKLPTIDKPEQWLDSQMLKLTYQLEQSIKGEIKKPQLAQIVTAIENCKEAKQMITANVNAKFVLINLTLNLNISK